MYITSLKSVFSYYICNNFYTKNEFGQLKRQRPSPGVESGQGNK